MQPIKMTASEENAIVHDGEKKTETGEKQHSTKKLKQKAAELPRGLPKSKRPWKTPKQK